MRGILAPISILTALVLFNSGCGGSKPTAETSPATGVAATAPGATAGMPTECNPKSPCAGSACLAAITAAASSVPVDACPRFGEFQSDVDSFAWNSFVALNWPANLSTCSADTTKSILDPATGPRVWETYMLDSNIFQAGGKAPAKWCDPNVSAKLISGERSFGTTFKAGRVHGIPGIDEAVGGVLTDQNGRFVRYEVRVNQDEYNYITLNTLFSKAGQNGKTINFPQGPNDNPSRCGSMPCGPVGAMEVKSAWKVLSPAEVSGGRFYMTKGIVYNDDKGTKSPGPNPVTLGLVGLHILHRTASAPNWFWSTFEQIDNTTTSFYNPSCPNCPQNKQTAAKPYTELNANGTPINKGVQLVRSTPIATTDASAPPMTAYYQKLLSGTVWANYQLVSTQWTTGGAPKGTPAVLANTTLETYIQPTSSCIGCHSSATTAVNTPAGFSFLLGEAQ
jgi:hypothetical protein